MATHADENAQAIPGSRRRSEAPRRLSGGEISHLALVAVPTLLLAALIAAGIWRQQVNQQHLQQAIAEMVSQDEPIGNRSLTAVFDRRTKPDASQQWMDVFRAVAEVDSRFSMLLIKRVDESERLVPPGQQWNAAPLVERYVRESEPIVRRVEQLIAAPTPVWQPLVIGGWGVWPPGLQDARGVLLLLRHRFRHAFHQGDHDEAMRTIRLMAQLPEAFDWRVDGAFLYFDLQDQHRETIRESMAHDFWTAEQLRQLDSLLDRHDDFDARWRQSLASDRAMLLAETQPDYGSDRLWIHSFDASMLPHGIPAQVRLSLVRQIERLQAATGAGTEQHVREAAEIQERFSDRPDFATGIAGIPLGDTRPVTDVLNLDRWVGRARLYARQAMQRRVTRLAVAIKRFQLQEKRWPRRLKELAAVGLSPADWHAVERRVPFGYEVGEEGAEAVVWTPNPDTFGEQNVQISLSPPSEGETDFDRYEPTEIRIR